MLSHKAALDPALASLLIALQEGTTAANQLQMDEVMALGRLQCIRFDRQGHMLITPRGREIAREALEELSA